MIPLFKVRMSEYVIDDLKPVIHSGYVAQGSKVDLFETELQKHLKSSYAPVTVNSCTSAIDLSLELCNVGIDDEVISTPQTCFASQIGAMHRGAKIRWADIDPITGLIDPKSVEKLITNKTKVIIGVNWAGKLCDFKSLKSFGIPVIEDAAHTWDTFFDKKYERGDYICYSFQAIKFLTCGDGGAIICPTQEKTEEAKVLRWFGLDRTKNESFRCTQNITKAGFKYHMNDISATIGLSNIKLANDSVLKQRKNSKHLIENVKNNLFVLPEFDDTTSFWLFSMHVLENKRQHFTSYLNEKGISSSPVHYRNDLYDCTLKFKEDDLPNVTKFTETQICIPNGWWLKETELNYIIETLNNYA